MTLLLVWHQHWKVFVIVFTVLTSLWRNYLTGLIFLYLILKDHNWAISKKPTVKRQQTIGLDETIQEDPRRLHPWSWTGARCALLEVRGVFHVPFKIQKRKKLRNPGPLDRSDQAPKPRTGPVLCEYYWRATFHVTLRGYTPLFTKSDTIDLAGHENVCRLSVWLVKVAEHQKPLKGQWSSKVRE